MEAMTEKMVVPQLRFREYDDDWRKLRLKDVSKYFNGGSFEGDVKEEGKFELITLKSIDIDGNLVNSKRYIDKDVPTLVKGTLIMILSEQAPGLLGMTSIIPINNKYVLNQRVAEIRPNQKVESQFLSLAVNINQRYFSKKGAGTKVQNITKPNVENFEFLTPTLPEQQKIATFLSSVDAKLQQLSKKKSLLADYKKGVMQKIFSQELRFKDANGNNYPDWEEKKLGDLCEIKKGQQLNKDELIEDGIYPAINGGINPSGYTNECNTPKNTITISEGGNSCGFINFIQSDFWSGGHCYSLLELNDNILGKYLFQILKHVQPLIMRLRVGSGLPNIQKKDINNFKVKLPSFAEQKKIATFLSALDAKIETVTTQINNTQAFKKGLLQQMFV